MFHIELRQFPHQTRRFNLTETELRARIVGPWTAQRVLTLDEREWRPPKARLTIYEGPPLEAAEIGLGRGWANVTRAGTDVTDQVLAAAGTESGTAAWQAAVEGLKRTLARMSEERQVRAREALLLASDAHPDWRPSERLGLAERAVWELLSEGGLALERGGEAVVAGQWQAVLLDWDTWADPDCAITLRSPDA